MSWAARMHAASLGRAGARGLIRVIQLYRHMVSPLRPASCRFVRTCSQYAVDALTEYGLVRGGWVDARRRGAGAPAGGGGWPAAAWRSGGRGIAGNGTRSRGACHIAATAGRAPMTSAALETAAT